MAQKKEKQKADRQAIGDLQEIAEMILDARRQRRRPRPIVIEFSGSPKSGKTSCISALDLFFRRNNYTTKLIGEKAHISPIKNKKNPFYNIWTFSSMVADLAATLGMADDHRSADGSKSPIQPDIILIDRGFFDAYCWFSWLRENNHLAAADFKALEPYVLMPKWLSCLDLVLVFTAPPEVSLEREFKMLLTNKEGSIMNSKVLTSFNDTIMSCYKDLQDSFRYIQIIDTKKDELKHLNYEVTLKALEILSQDSGEFIGYVSAAKFDKVSEQVFPFRRLGITNSLIEYEKRNLVEKDFNKIQLVPIIVITNREHDKVLIVKKNKVSNTNSPEKNRWLPYLGGHVRREDIPVGNEKTIINTLNKALSREIKEEIGVDYAPGISSNTMSIWIQNKERSKQHIAVCTLWEVDFQDFRFSLDPIEFSVESKGKSLLDIGSIYKVAHQLEDWGTVIFEKFFNIKIPRMSEPKLFEDIDL